MAGLGTGGGRARTKKGSRAVVAGGDGRRVRGASFAKAIELTRKMPE